MDFEHGLALVQPHNINTTKRFDLNTKWLEHKLTISNDITSCPMGKANYGGGMIKEKKPEAYSDDDDNGQSRTMFPLVSWNGLPNEEEDDRSKEKDRNSITIDNDDENGSGVVGWPPIKSWRKKLLHHGGHGHRTPRRRNGQRNRMQAAAESRSSTNASIYVKVKMDGVDIPKKIDLRLYRSYNTLTTPLITMFTKCEEIDERDGARYTLLYQDNEGDWLLVGDVPWQAFIESVQRMEIVRNAD